MQNFHGTPIQVIFIGPQESGKTTLIECLKENKNNFQEPYSPTAGITFSVKNIKKEEKNYKLQIWDAAGSKAYRQVVASFIKEKHIIIIVIDSYSENAQNDFIEFICMAANFADQIAKKHIIVIKSKTDLADKKESLTDEDIKEIPATRNLSVGIHKILKCSVKTEQGIDQIFETIINLNLFEKFSLSNTANYSASSQQNPAPTSCWRAACSFFASLCYSTCCKPQQQPQQQPIKAAHDNNTAGYRTF